MARRRRISKRNLRLLVSLLVIGAGVWFFGLRSPGTPEEKVRPLTGTRPLEKAPAATEPLAPEPEAGLDRQPAAEPAQQPQPAEESETLASLSRESITAERPEPVTAFQPPAATRPASPDADRATRAFQAGLAARDENDLLAARKLMNEALHAGLPADKARTARRTLIELAERTLFNRGAVRDDPLAGFHVVQRGEALGKIAKEYAVSAELLAEINHLPDKNFIREGQRLKVVYGPFHATISRQRHEMHMYLQDTYVRTYRVALGANGSTPRGTWKVVNQQENPSWTDPRTGQRWHANDPENPIGDYWIGLEGIDGEAVGQFGYGIHGTIEPETIGTNVSLGCVRLAPGDIDAVFKMLMPHVSIVTIQD